MNVIRAGDHTESRPYIETWCVHKIAALEA